MQFDNACDRWKEFSEKFPEQARSIREQATKVCEINGGAEEALKSGEFAVLRDIISEYHEEIGIPNDIGETDLLRWVTYGVFKSLLASEQKRT